MRRSALSLTLALALLGSACLAGEVGFLEDFALAKDRTVPLKQLIPGTRDYYYYHCLHYQNAGQLDEVDRVLKAWIARYRRTGRVHEIENRQALLRYAQDPAKSLNHIKTRLGIHFNHKRELLDQKTKLPTTLDPNRISRQTLTARALARHGTTLNGFEDRALAWVLAMKLHPDARRHLLRRLARPDHATLPKLVVDDLNYKYSRGFGSHPVHGRLLLSQLEECLKLKADLLNHTRFVQTYLTKLHPNPDLDWRHDAAVREAFLDRLWAFVSRLDPSHNSLKAHVLYHRLAHDRAKGVYDKQRFMTYIKLPRRASYISREYMRDRERQRYAANLNADYRQFTLLPRIGNDEPLVRSYLVHFFREEDSIKPYDTYINDLYLKHAFAETKIVNGIGDMEKWYSMLPPATYQRLKERIDLEFAFTNKTVFGPNDPVSLDVHVKNVKTLLVKVYEINTLNYYVANRREIDTAIELDGLVANDEKTYTYTEPPLRRVARHFDFPNLGKRGVYVVELIGNGRSSRALVRKGKLRYLARTSTAGHVFTILDEANKKLPDANLWLAGHKYAPDKDGTLTVPFTNRPGGQPIVLTHGDFASLDSFGHEAERYRLSAGIHVEREALLKRKKASLVVRTALHLNGTPVTLTVLEEPTLVLTSVDREGVATTKEVHDFKLFENKESAYEFQVPANLARIGFTVKAKVQNLSQNKKQDLAVSRHFTLNGIDRTEKIEDLHLIQADGKYALDVLGKTGEPKANRPVILTLKHRDFRDTVDVTLQTDDRGRVALGALSEIQWLRARGPEGTQHTWYLLEDAHSYPSTVHGRAGETVSLPYMGAAQKPPRSELSLLEKRGSTFTKDRFAALAIKDGFLQLRDLPRGDYDLLLKDSGTHVAVRLTQGAASQGYVLSENRLLEVQNPKPLQIDTVTADAETVKIQLRNATKFARVHVAATRYQPEYPIYPNVGAIAFPEPYLINVSKAESLYVVGRDIGEEFRYILERKYAKKFPGNMLKRPSLLLNPWAIRKTETGVQRARPGGEYARKRAPGRGRRGRAAGTPSIKPPPARGGFANLDFLATPAVLLANLEADENGVVTIKREDIGGHNQLHVVAVDPGNTAYRIVSLPEADLKIDDQRLIASLEAAKHFAEQKQITAVGKNKPFVLGDITTSKFETYDTLAKVYALYATLSSNPTLVEFGFILNWPKLKPEEKREKYSKYACHELSFFLSKKDPEFFQAVIVPYLKNKKDKTFLDRWLLGDDLSAYLKPWAFGQLNIVERILLAQRVAGERPHTERHVKDLFDLIPPNIERFNHLFKTALKGRALDTGDAFGLGKAIEREARLKAAGEKLAQLRRAGRPGPATPAKPTARPEPVAPPAPPAAKKPPRDAPAEKAKERAEAKADDEADDAEGFFERDAKKRTSVRQFYRKLDKTKEWVENNYWQLPIERQNASLITVSPFWNDYARRNGGGFFSTNLAEASRNFPEMMLALAVLDLPFEAAEHKSAIQAAKFTLTAASPMVVFHKEIKAADMADEKVPILISQNFFRHGDRYRHVGNERYDKYVTDEFLIHVVYGCHVVITNPTSARQKLDVLLQIPRGAIAVLNGQFTKSRHVDLQPYRTQTFDYYFYFPTPGKMPHYPVHVAKNEKLIAFAKPFTLNVVERLTKIDRTSWDYISQHGTEDQVVSYLNLHNLGRIKLNRIAWRVQDRAFFRRVVPLLERRHVYDHTLWSYALKHNELAAAREYLQHSPYATQCGATIDTPLLTIDPVARKTYQHMEYWPLVNARAHQLGKRRKILNDRFYQQYLRFLKVLSYRGQLDDDDRMTVVYYLLLQERVGDALRFFADVRAQRLATLLQHDYFEAHLAFYTDRLRGARQIADKYADHPVDKWRNRFAAVAAQLDEIEGKQAKVVDKEDRTEQQTKLAATEASFDFDVEAKKITLTYQSMTACRVNYYLMDIELLFSRNPFVEKYSGQFAFIRPNATQAIQLDPKKTTQTFDLPARFHSSNVRIEITAAGVKKAKAYFSNNLAVQVIENYGQVKITHKQTGKPLPRVYVKVYARMKNGRVRFYKDGYTDLRGRFDYTSLNTNELDFVQRFSILVLSETDGAVVREASPPKR